MILNQLRSVWLCYIFCLAVFLAMPAISAAQGSSNSKKDDRIEALLELQIMPALNINRSFGIGSQTIGFNFENAGNGAANLKQLEVFFDGELIKDWNELSKKVESENLMFWEISGRNENGVYPKPRWHSFNEGTAMAVGKTVWLYYIDGSLFDFEGNRAKQVNAQEQFIKLATRVGIRIKYCSFAGKCSETSLGKTSNQ